VPPLALAELAAYIFSPAASLMEALDVVRSIEAAHVVVRVDERDRGTPDEWVMRDASLVRLTGRCVTAAPARELAYVSLPTAALFTQAPVQLRAAAVPPPAKRDG